MILELPAGPHERFAPTVAESMVGHEFDLDERIAGLGGLVAQQLSADERGLWTRARIVAAEVIREGRAVRVEVVTV